ncbi:MAG: hypothetical protein M3Y39_16730 [Chloroflexota bacterium]|nr:hypothetical protein [Chloroflexota bacterium]
MKRSDTGDFCVLYIEQDDEKESIFRVISEQKKPIVIMLMGRGQRSEPPGERSEMRVFQRPEDFAELKHLRRHLGVPVLFVISGSESLIQLAGRHGFPVYRSMDTLADAIASGQRQRGVSRRTVPLSPLPESVPRRTIPLNTLDAPAVQRRTVPLLATEPTVPRSPQPDFIPISRNATPINGNGRNGNGTMVTGASGVSDDVPTRNNTPLRNDYVWAYESVEGAATNGKHASTTRNERATAPPDPLGSTQPAANVATVPLAHPGPAAKSRINRLALGVLILLLFALITAGLGYFLVLSHNLPSDTTAAPNALVGHVSFLSSNQISENSNQGLNDKILVDLTNLAQPATGKSYYAWLLSDKSQSDTQSILLGVLPVNNGHAQLLYPGDASHTNLLAITSRFLVTEEDTTPTPLTPSPDYSTWRYYGEFSQTPINAPDNTNHYSYLDHLRHLLAADPTLNELELPGGLNTWFYRNVSKILEWTSSTREQWQETNDAGFVRRQTLRTLTYLDGVSFVTKDLPPNTGLNVNERLARVGLLQVDGATQDPPSYLAHISHHLYGLLESDAASASLRQNITSIVAALDNVQAWLQQVRRDALQIMKMSDQQLRQPATLMLLNDMIDNATNAFTGQVDPATGQMREGVTWIHDQIQALAVLDVKHITASGPALQFVPNTNLRRASMSEGKA